MATKTYSRRDSATSYLRKLGVNKKDYARLITTDGKTFSIDETKARKAVLGTADADPRARQAAAHQLLQTSKTGTPKDPEAANLAAKRTKMKDKTTKQPVSTGEVRPLAHVIRDLIRAGKTNEQILDQLRLPEGKLHYPTWYRAELRRKGQL